jgi:DNA-binding HxlR family transcriptional regulator
MGLGGCASLDPWSCPVARAARVLGDTCSLLILRDLAAGPRRFGELLGSAAGNTRLLSGRLRRLTRIGVLTRTCLPGHPLRVEYALTPMGRDLLPALEALRSFGERWLPERRDPLAVSDE